MTRLVVDTHRRTRGPASLAQGVYGSRGNLELVVADEVDGLWVHWFNSDLPTDPPATAEVPPGTWSAGLRFAEGRRYDAAVIVQSPLGPDHLEVLALADDGEVESWYWSPGPGFQRRDALVAEHADAISVRISRDGTLEAQVLGEDGWRRVIASPDGYPARNWVDHGPLGDAAIAITDDIVSTRDGGTRERVFRDEDGRLVHEATPAEA